MTIRACINSDEKDLLNDFPELYHYTNLTSLREIVKTNSLWATHFWGLNDLMEIKIFREIFQNHLSNWLINSSDIIRVPIHGTFELKESKKLSSIEAKLIANQLIDVLYLKAVSEFDNRKNKIFPTYSNPFVTCFCNHSKDSSYMQQNGLLSQWRGYAAKNGCCIVFDTLSIIDLLEAECDQFNYLNIFFSDVTYSDERKKIKSWSEELYPLFSEFFGNSPRHDGDFFTSPLVKFISSISLFKHKAFKEEREVRIAASPLTMEDIQLCPGINKDNMPIKKLQSRIINDRSVNYISLFEDLKQPLPIKRIIVGPSKDQKKNRDTIRQIVGDKIEITISKIPYLT